MATIEQDFPSAPLGRRASLGIMIAAFAAIVGTAVAFYTSLHSPHRLRPVDKMILLIAPVAVPLVLIPVALYQRSAVQRIRIENTQLIWGKKSRSLVGLTRMERDPHILKWACRLGGNGGLGAIRGRFWSKRVGKFEAFMTDPEKAVVLRWPDQTLAVSPQDPDFFMYTVRSASGFK
jgi:hypothetical protein